MANLRFKLAAMDFGGGEKHVIVFMNGKCRVILYDEEADEFFMVNVHEFLKLKNRGFPDDGETD